MSLMQLLGQIFPLLVFIIADSVFNNVRISIISAIVFAAGQLAYYYMKTGHIDWFVFIDVGLIAALGVISIYSRNDIFFKVKPALIEGITIVFFIVLIVLPGNFLYDYIQRFMPEGMIINTAAIGTMKKMLAVMCGYLLLHIGAVLYTAFHSSRKVWAFVSGPGFFVLFIPVMIVVLAGKFRKKGGYKQAMHKSAGIEVPKNVQKK